MDGTAAARVASEAAARHAYGKLLAWLAARTRNLAAAEDALAEAFRIALTVWPDRGVPDQPEAWLLTVARRAAGGTGRHQAVRDAAAPALRLLAEEAADVPDHGFPDERLKLLFVCAHPDIDPAMRAPLMLQTVLGLDSARIASAFLVAPSTMAQRLVRAKARIAEARIPFSVPDPAELGERLAPVLDGIYAAYGRGWDDVAGADPRRRDLAQEAIWLGSMLVALLPREPEAHGLLALMLFCEARKPARRDASGAYVPLARQDTRLWSRTQLEAAERALHAAAALHRPGRFQTEAAIQSAHAHRRLGGRVAAADILRLYDALLAFAPSLGAQIGRAAAFAEAVGPEAGLVALNALAPRATGYQPFWALRAHLLASLGQDDDAAEAYRRAVGLSEDAAVRAWLLRQAPRSA